MRKSLVMVLKDQNMLDYLYKKSVLSDFSVT